MTDAQQPRVCVVIPCLNEEVTVGKVVKDFSAALPLMTPDQRRWLADSLRRIDRGHHWLRSLA